MGHIFQLGRKYADALDLKVLDDNGKLVTVTMGSYGIGVSRAVAAIAEKSYDDRGLIWPREIAPADVHVVIAGKTPEIAAAAEDLARRWTRPGSGCCSTTATPRSGSSSPTPNCSACRPSWWSAAASPTAWSKCGTGPAGTKSEVPLAEIAGQLVHLVRTGHLRVRGLTEVERARSR